MTQADAALTRARHIDQLCDRFEAEWKAGCRPSVDAYVALASGDEQDALRSALQAVERELRGRSLVDTSVTRSSVSSPTPRNADTPAVSNAKPDNLPAAIGRFAIEGVLGAGAFGKVYRAVDPRLGRQVALKVPLPETVAAPAERTRFIKEAQAAATINHPNVCQIHEVGEHEGQPYIVMALVPGQSLAETLKSRKTPLPERQTALLVRKIAIALAAAHDKGIVHRDLKPANVMFDRERKDIVLMDFGLARGPQLGDARITQSGMVMGTPAYMSPEQARGDSKDIGPAGDVFSLGVILYELLAGARPFAGTATEVIGQILHVDPQPPSQRRPGIDPRLEAICLRAMAKNPAERFGSMREFAVAIDAMLRAPQPDESVGAGQSMVAEKPGSETIADVFAALSADRKQAQAETAAAVEAAIARHRTPRWVVATIGMLVIGSIATLAGVVFFTRSDKVKVTIELTDVDLADKTLTFFLDEQPISAEALANPIELKPGEHELVVKRGEEVVKRMLLTVSGGAQPGIKIRDIPPEEPDKIVWTPLITSADELIAGETASANADGRSVKFHDGILEMKGAGASFRPKFSGKNYIVRAEAMFLDRAILFYVRRTPQVFGGYGAFFNNYDADWNRSSCGIGKQAVGRPWQDLQGTLQRVSDELPLQLAMSAFGNQIAIYINGQRVVVVSDQDAAEGGISFLLSKDHRHAILRNVEVCVLDGTDLTPDDVLPQQQDPQVTRWLSPEYLTDELRKQNLLSNGGFELEGSSWKFESWRSNPKVLRVVDSPTHSGSKAAELSFKLNDAATHQQSVPVKPGRKYLLSGWIKTQNLRYAERNHKGADLFVPGTYLHSSPNVPTTTDWTYYAVIVPSGNRKTMEVGIRLGVSAGTVTGTAWFDDICLIELAD